jgi:hypothetical protein
MERMMWIKPSFLWMMYRFGLGLKDSGQARTFFRKLACIVQTANDKRGQITAAQVKPLVHGFHYFVVPSGKFGFMTQIKFESLLRHTVAEFDAMGCIPVPIDRRMPFRRKTRCVNVLEAP